MWKIDHVEGALEFPSFLPNSSGSNETGYEAGDKKIEFDGVDPKHFQGNNFVFLLYIKKIDFNNIWEDLAIKIVNS